MSVLGESVTFGQLLAFMGWGAFLGFAVGIWFRNAVLKTRSTDGRT